MPAEIAASWIELFRPAARLVPGGDGQRVGQLGGSPSLPVEAEWPKWPEVGPLTFIAEVDCAALPRETLDIPLPERGRLLFFYFDGRYQVDHDDPYLDPAEPQWAQGARVVFVPAGVPTSERPAPAGLRPYPRVDLTTELMATAPQQEHHLLEQVRLGTGLSLTGAIEDVRVGDQDGPDVFDELIYRADPHGPRHRIGGFADPVQGPVEQEIAALVLDGVPWDDPRHVQEAARWVLLAQFDSHDFGTGDDEMMMWGDAGSLYWLIPRDDLAAGRFDAARFTMQCG
ncbi:YwqG family protein [Amycolatopsis taiwanensis]|uniref:YwqG family protein n=1 Tax=Amycolatopsis taiwanensis TaxID=342230 RepID=UPI002556E1FF|nr:YwqG family protein [Amycolatopsis taiwanensis]